MAENEEIDLLKARRWQPVLQAVCHGESVEDVAEKVRDCLYKTLRAVKKQVPLDHLLVAAEDDPASLARAARESVVGRDYFQLLAQGSSFQTLRLVPRLSLSAGRSDGGGD